jgi:hypothetical protein
MRVKCHLLSLESLYMGRTRNTRPGLGTDCYCSLAYRPGIHAQINQAHSLAIGTVKKPLSTLCS